MSHSTETSQHGADEKAETADISDPNNLTLTGHKLHILLISLSLACFLILLDSSIVATAIPKITDEFNSLPDIGWYASAYQLASAALQPLTGKVYLNFNLKWSFIGFFLVFELGSALCGASQSSTMLIISRAVAGMGASGLINGALVVLAATVPLHRRPPLMGMMLAVGQCGIVAGPLIGGAFTTGYTWRWCFYVNLPLGLFVVIPLILLRLPEQIPKDPLGVTLCNLHKRLDLIGFVILASFAIELLLALQYGGNTFAWRSSQVIGLFCGAATTFVAWLTWNWHRGKDALLSFPVISRRHVWMSGLCYSAMMVAVYGVSYFLPIYFQAIKGVNAVMSGVYMLASILPQVVASASSGILVQKVGRVPPFVIFGGILITVSSGLFSLLQPDTSTGKWVGFQILSGVGRGIVFQMPLVAVQNHVSQAELSDGMAFLVFAQTMSPAIFVSILNAVFDAKLRSELQSMPNIDAGAIIEAGATGFRQIVSASDLPTVLEAYSNSLDILFYIMAGVGSLTIFAGLGMGWKRIGKKSGAQLSGSMVDEES